MHSILGLNQLYVSISIVMYGYVGSFQNNREWSERKNKNIS